MLRLQAYLPYRLSVASNAVSRLVADAYQQRFGLTVPQWRLIAVLADEGALTPQQLCARTVMDKVTVMRAAQGLLRRRLVRRQPHPSDGRSHRLQLSASGRALHAQVVPLARSFEAKLLADVPAAEAALLARLLRRLQQVAEAEHAAFVTAAIRPQRPRVARRRASAAG